MIWSSAVSYLVLHKLTTDRNSTLAAAQATRRKVILEVS
jgi:hypothetical protein